jgi:hypothetical protein
MAVAFPSFSVPGPVTIRPCRALTTEGRIRVQVFLGTIRVGRGGVSGPFP